MESQGSPNGVQLIGIQTKIDPMAAEALMDAVTAMQMVDETTHSDKVEVEDLIPALPVLLTNSFYTRLYPTQLILKWLSYGDVESVWLQNREFTFVLGNFVYNRHKFFNNEQDMKEELLKSTPLSIDIGAVYSQRVESNMSLAIPIGRELAFDIDLSEYDAVRTCCSGSGICNKCWRFMSIATKILDVALRYDFGYKHILWVFSGRRGIHCWVCDKAARELDDATRLSIVQYLTVVQPIERQKKVHFTWNLLPYCIRRAKVIIAEQFESIVLDDQDMLGSPEGVTKLLSMVENKEVMEQLKVELEKLSTSTERWQVTKQLLTHLQETGKLESDQKHLLEEIMFQYTYPRLDQHVSIHMNHLLKSPFTIHPKTGKLCLPFDPNTIDEFDPCNVPTFRSVLKEMQEFVDVNGTGTNNVYNETSMKPSILLFEEFIRNMAV